MKLAEFKATCPNITVTVDGVYHQATTSGQFLDHCLLRIPELGLRCTISWTWALRAYNTKQSIPVQYP